MTMKIVVYATNLRLKASPSYGGQGIFFDFFVTDPPRERPIGGGGIHRNY
jgi:hypothetical protein